MDQTPGDAIDPIEQLRGGGSQALADLFDRYRDRLRRMVELRIDARVRARLDASDVLQEALNTLDPIDREVVAPRHFEQLSRSETSEVLGISQEAGAKRYFRTLKRLKEVLASMPGGWQGI